MKKKGNYYLVILAILLVLLIPGKVFADENVDIQCDDKAFYDEMVNNLEKLGKSITKNDETMVITMTQSEVDSITELNFGGRDTTQITSLKGIENFRSLMRLKITGFKLSNLSMIENLINLKTLNLAGNNISNIESLANLINLETLDLCNNNISNIETLENLINLETLDLSNNNISNIETLENLINLETLDLSGNNIIDISSLSNLVKINKLRLSGDCNLGTLSNLVSLRELTLDFVSNISGIDSIPNLSTLKLFYRGDTNNDNMDDMIKTIKKMPSLDTLYLKNTNLNDISELDNLANLRTLKIDNTIVKEIEITDGNATTVEVELPQIILAAKDQNSKIYTDKEYQFEYCKLSEDGKKIIIDLVALFEENMRLINELGEEAANNNEIVPSVDPSVLIRMDDNGDGKLLFIVKPELHISGSETIEPVDIVADIDTELASEEEMEPEEKPVDKSTAKSDLPQTGDPAVVIAIIFIAIIVILNILQIKGTKNKTRK